MCQLRPQTSLPLAMQVIEELAFERERNVAKTWLEWNKYNPNLVVPREHCLIKFSLSLRIWDKPHLCSLPKRKMFSCLTTLKVCGTFK